MPTAHLHPIRVYYEDTDFSGVVYHANYLKYCERAREHLLGPDELVRLFREEGVGFVVYRAELSFKEGARFGDELVVATTVKAESEYRAIFRHLVRRRGEAEAAEGGAILVDATVHLVCVNREQRLVPLPASVWERLGR